MKRIRNQEEYLEENHKMNSERWEFILPSFGQTEFEPHSSHSVRGEKCMWCYETGWILQYPCNSLSLF